MPPLRGIPSEFLDETYTTNTRGMMLLNGENSIFSHFRLIYLCDGQTDGQTDGFAIAYSMLSCAKNSLEQDGLPTVSLYLWWFKKYGI